MLSVLNIFQRKSPRDIAQAERDARSKKFREEFEARQQASREAEKARAEMQRRAAAYDGLVAQRDALRAELKEATEAINDPAVNNLRTLPESIRVLCAQRDALLEALRRHVELHDGDCICEDCAAIKKAEGGQ